MRLALALCAILIIGCAHARRQNKCSETYQPGSGSWNECVANLVDQDRRAADWKRERDQEVRRAREEKAREERAGQPPSTFWQDFNAGFQAGQAVGKAAFPTLPPIATPQSPKEVRCETRDRGYKLETICTEQ